MESVGTEAKGFSIVRVKAGGLQEFSIGALQVPVVDQVGCGKALMDRARFGAKPNARCPAVSMTHIDRGSRNPPAMPSPQTFDRPAQASPWSGWISVALRENAGVNVWDV